MTKEDKKDWGKFKDNFEEQLDNELLDEEDSLVDEEEATEAALDHPNYAELEEKLTLAEQKAHENWEKSVRAVAELDNVRRRMEREVANAHKYGAEKLISALLPIVDSLEQALQLAEKGGDTAMHEGLELTMKLFVDVLQKFDVTMLDPIGEIFDPQQHEAMAMQPAADVAPNTVIAVFQKGYKLSDRIIRPARVVVAKNN
ncbi:nucleotide exchange factor GrpE [Legionella sp. km772]|uniref:nucleotide exchange factor GrpE n=1 Tax=Legionella sp. km772 TaxID=2498111 RepID=UPI000F8D2AD7|nr:nucleotide exchange factor GrpE [Legionella sp. km772]RUR09886.1 nucleotide exchange factor GrpE [Legionella sp. km772]